MGLPLGEPFLVSKVFEGPVIAPDDKGGPEQVAAPLVQRPYDSQ